MVLIYLPPTGQGLGCVVLFPKGPRSHLGACQVLHATPLLWEHGGHQLLFTDPQVGLDPPQLKGPRELVPLEQEPREQEPLFSSPCSSQTLDSLPSSMLGLAVSQISYFLL